MKTSYMGFMIEGTKEEIVAFIEEHNQIYHPEIIKKEEEKQEKMEEWKNKTTTKKKTKKEKFCMMCGKRLRKHRLKTCKNCEKAYKRQYLKKYYAEHPEKFYEYKTKYAQIQKPKTEEKRKGPKHTQEFKDRQRQRMITKNTLAHKYVKEYALSWEKALEMANNKIYHNHKEDQTKHYEEKTTYKELIISLAQGIITKIDLKDVHAINPNQNWENFKVYAAFIGQKNLKEAGYNGRLIIEPTQIRYEE